MAALCGDCLNCANPAAGYYGRQARPKPLGGNNEICLIVALVGLVRSLALPAFAQQEGTVDPQIVQRLRKLDRKADEAYKKGDATARAALFTEDAILVNQKGLFSGREAIEAYYADLFTGAHFRHDPNGR